MSRHILQAAASVAAAIAAASALPPVAAAQQHQMVVSTEWLAANLTNPGVVLIEVIDRRPGTERGEHIPGARQIHYRSLVQDIPGDAHGLPSVDSIRSLLASAGMSNTSHVVLTGSPLAVTRAFYTIEYFGHPKVSALDGGLTKWKAEGRPVETTEPAARRGQLDPHPTNFGVIATTEWLRDRVGKPGIALFDTRTEGEYLGTGNGLGHLEGARRVEYRSYFTSETEFALQDRTTLMRLFRERVTAPTDTVIAYCAVGYRASGTYFVARFLGLPVKLYDGSYDSWMKAGLPLTKTPTP